MDEAVAGRKRGKDRSDGVMSEAEDGGPMRTVLAVVLGVGVQGLGAFELREGEYSVEQ